jgi:serine/threonine protein kinase
MPMLDALADENYLYLIFPFASGGDLFDAVAGTEGGMEEGVARSYFTDVVQGLSFLKANGMAHGDVSLENVVVCVEEEDGREERREGGVCQKVLVDDEEEEEERRRREGGRKTCRLIDLEMARFLPQEATSSVHRRARAGLRNAGGKRGYIAPECVNGTVSDWLAADIWSLGICLYTMLTRHPLYLDPEELGFELLCRGEAGRVIEYYRTEHGLGLPAAAAELVEWMLCPHPEGRPTLEQVLGHEWVRGGGREGGMGGVVDEEGVVAMVVEVEEEEEEGGEGGRGDVQPSSPVAWAGVEEASASFFLSPITNYGSIDSVLSSSSSLDSSRSSSSGGGKGEGEGEGEGESVFRPEDYKVCGCCQMCLAEEDTRGSRGNSSSSSSSSSS